MPPRRIHLIVAALAAVVVAALAAVAGGADPAAARPNAASNHEMVFFSTQLVPVAEAAAVRNVISVIGGLHGNYVSLRERNVLMPLNDVATQLRRAGIPRSFMNLGKLGTRTQQYIPWMQATYVLVANTRALPLLPKGAGSGASGSPRATRGSSTGSSRATSCRRSPGGTSRAGTAPTPSRAGGT